MLTENEIMEKIYELPEHFNRSMKNREYDKAKYYYQQAVTLSTFLKIPESDSKKLFGTRPYVEDWEEPEDGLFREGDVLKAYEECFKHEEERIMQEKEEKQRNGDRYIYHGMRTKK